MHSDYKLNILHTPAVKEDEGRMVLCKDIFTLDVKLHRHMCAIDPYYDLICKSVRNNNFWADLKIWWEEYGKDTFIVGVYHKPTHTYVGAGIARTVGNKLSMMIETVYIEEEHRGKGILRGLTDMYQDICKRIGVSSLTINSSSVNGTVTEQYAHLGFIPYTYQYAAIINPKGKHPKSTFELTRYAGMDAIKVSPRLAGTRRKLNPIVRSLTDNLFMYNQSLPYMNWMVGGVSKARMFYTVEPEEIQAIFNIEYLHESSFKKIELDENAGKVFLYDIRQAYPKVKIVLAHALCGDTEYHRYLEKLGMTLLHTRAYRKV